MSVSKVQRTKNITASAIYAVYGTHKNMKAGDVRAALTTIEARGVNNVMGFATQTIRDVKSGRLKRSNEALVLVQSWHPNVLDKDNPRDVDLAHTAGVELARELVNSSDFLVATHLDGKSGHVHNHIIIANHDFASGKTPKEAGNWHRLKLLNDKVSKQLGLDQREHDVLGYEVGREEVSYSQAERMALAQGRTIDSTGISINELTGDNWRDFMRNKIEDLLTDPAITDAPNVDAGIEAMKARASAYNLVFSDQGSGHLSRKNRAKNLPNVSFFQLIDDDGEVVTYKTPKRERKAQTSGKKLGSDYSIDGLRERIANQQRQRQNLNRLNQFRHHQERTFDNAAKPKKTTSRSRTIQCEIGQHRPNLGGRLLETEGFQDPTGSDSDQRLRTSRKELDRAIEKARNLTREAETNNCGNQGAPTGDGFDGRCCNQRGGNSSHPAPRLRPPLPESSADGKRDSHTPKRHGQGVNGTSGTGKRATSTQRQRSRTVEHLHREATDADNSTSFGESRQPGD